MKRKGLRALKLSANDPFTPGLLVLMTLPTSLALNLSETELASSSASVVLANFLYSTLLAIGVIYALKPLYRSAWANPILTPLIALAAGMTKGLTIWLFTDLSGQEQNSLGFRILVSGLSWMVFLTLAAYFKEQVLENFSANQKLRFQISKARKRHSNLDQQLEWLKQAQISGLSKTLAAQLVRITKRLNDEGAGPAAYQDLAKELRDASRNQVRAKSRAVWNSQDSSFIDRIAEILRTAPNPLLATSLYFATAGLNSLRLGGLAPELLTILFTSMILFVWLWLARNNFWLQNLTFVVAFGSDFAFQMLLQSSAQGLIGPGVSAALWSQAMVIFASLWRVSATSEKALTKTLTEELSTAQSEAEWLALQLESQNMEIAKYLHAILQTRLMAYAMQLENEGLTPDQLAELTKLLENPLREFQPQSGDLAQLLEKLRVQWLPIVEVSIQIPSSPKFADLDTATMQLIQEAIANSVRHGLADKVSIRVKDLDTRMVEVEDNGLGPRTGEPGLGSEVFDSLTKHWKLERAESGGAVLTASI